MATLDILPSDIVLRIIHLLTLDAGKRLTNWKAALPILALSRQWRICAADALYCTAIVGKGPSIEIGYQDIYDASYNNDMEKHNQRTNIGLIQSNGFQSCVSDIVISQTPDHSAYQSLDIIVDALTRTDVSGWSNARSLSVTFCQTFSNIELSFEEMGKDEYGAERDALKLIRWLPNIQKLVARTMICDDVLKAFLRTLGCNYLPRLTQLWWLTPALLGLGYYSEKLTDYELCQANNEWQLPTIDPRPLQMLNMRPFKDTFLWSCFLRYRGIESNRLEFTNLRSLVLDGHHHGIHVSDSFDPPLGGSLPLKPVFPVLERLVIKGVSLRPETYKLFAASPLKTVVFSGTLANLRLLHTLGLSRLDLLYVDVGFGVYFDRDKAFYDGTNSIMQNATSIDAVVLSINMDNTILTPTSIRWQNLTHLCIYEAEVDDFALNVLPVLPRLIHLKVCSYDFGNGHAIDEIEEYLDDLRRRYPGPLMTSNVNTVVLILSHARSKVIDSPLIRIFQDYLPTLEFIEVR